MELKKIEEPSESTASALRLRVLAYEESQKFSDHISEQVLPEQSTER